MDKLKETLGKLWGTVKTKWTDIGKKGHIIFFSVVGVLVASAVVLAVLLNHTDYAVLYSGASSEETAEILTVIRTDLGTTEVTINPNGDILVPEDQVEELRVQLSMLGYPKSTFNYNIWDTGVSMFSTESDKRVKEKQQLQENLRATLTMYEGVDSAIVILAIPETNDYVISNTREEASASVVLMLNKELSPSVIEGIYNLVKTAVPGLKEENITVTDGEGNLLTTEEIVQQQEENGEDEIDLYNKRLDVQNNITAILKDKLVELFDGVFPDFRVGVDIQLNYDSQVTQITEYTPSVDAEGNRGGMVNNEKYVSAGGGEAAEGGVVGTAVDADISPDYPTYEVGQGDEFYFEWQKEINYLVNEEIRQIQKEGYSYDNISATVVVDATGISQAETEEWQSAIANAIGADYSRVTFKAYPFTLDGTDGSAIGSDGTVVVPGGRDMWIFVIIALGVILVILLIIALFASGSGKKRAKIRRAAAAASPSVTQTSSFGSSMTAEEDMKQRSYDTEETEDYEIQSLTETSDESREAMLKKEIRDFSKTNPEIVAQLIRTWLKNDE